MILDLYYSNTYQEARDKFLTYVCDKQHIAKKKVIELKKVLSPNKEKLYIDIVYFGNKNATKLLVHTSGVHGVEGFAGSAIQSFIIKNRLKKIDKDVAIVFVHIVNPYGMSWGRRVNENNVDLNRNITNNKGDKCHPIYHKLNDFLNPKSEPWNWNLSFFINAAISKIKYNPTDLKNAIASGQNVYPNGLFFSGMSRISEIKRKKIVDDPKLSDFKNTFNDEQYVGIEQGPIAIIKYIKSIFKEVKNVVHIDVHTGLGKYGYDTILYNAEQDAIIRKFNEIQSLKSDLKQMGQTINTDLYMGLGKDANNTLLYNNTQHDDIICEFNKSQNLSKTSDYEKEVYSFAKAFWEHSQVSNKKVLKRPVFADGNSSKIDKKSFHIKGGNYHSNDYVAYDTSGLSGYMFSEFCFPKARFYGVTQEFGTYSNIKILKALIKENFYFNNLTNTSFIKHGFSKNKRFLLDLFYPKDKIWRKKVLERGLKVFDIAYNWLIYTQYR